MKSNNSNLHLTLDERRIILAGIKNGSTKTAIAQTLGKDNSTIAKEIRLHRVLSHPCRYKQECKSFPHCPYDRDCKPDCDRFEQFVCKRRDRTPGACNGCSNFSHCHFNKFMYKPEEAQDEYEKTLVASREGVNLTSTEAQTIADIISPLLKQGQAPYQIIKAHPELHISEKTLYNYIDNDVFGVVANINNLDLRRKVSRSLPKKKSTMYKKREDRKFLIGRTYKDYILYKQENPEAFVTQMDTVYNDVSNGPFIQTFKFINAGILFAIFHTSRTSQAMVDGINLLENILSKPIFDKYVHILLTDRGSEFVDALAMETDKDGLRRTRVFYCDPMQAGQKGSIENMHVLLRYILPKETNLFALGLTDQDKLNLALSHINSVPSRLLGNRSPLELTSFLFPDLYEKLSAFGINFINSDNIILKPYLLK